MSYGCCCVLSILALAISYTAYMGIFAFNNPNPEAWYVDGALVPTLPAEGTEFTAVHDQYVTWFLWGFIN